MCSVALPSFFCHLEIVWRAVLHFALARTGSSILWEDARASTLTGIIESEYVLERAWPEGVTWGSTALKRVIICLNNDFVFEFGEQAANSVVDRLWVPVDVQVLSLETIPKFLCLFVNLLRNSESVRIITHQMRLWLSYLGFCKLT